LVIPGGEPCRGRYRGWGGGGDEGRGGEEKPLMKYGGKTTMGGFKKQEFKKGNVKRTTRER